MTLKEPDAADSAIAAFVDGAGDGARRATNAARSARPKRKPDRPAEEPEQSDLFPSPHEQRAAKRYIERRQRSDAKPQVSFARTESGQLKAVSGAHPDDDAAASLAVMDTFATGYCNFSTAMTGHLQKIVRDGNGVVDGQKLAEAVAMVQGISPKTELETMLAVQMAAIHLGTVECAHQFARAPKHLKSEPAFLMAKMARTFAAQAETFKNIRLNGRQEIHVFHHRDQQNPAPREIADITDRDLQQIATGRPPRGSGFQQRQSHEPEALDSPIDCSTSVPREIKEIAAGLPRPRNARP